MSQMQGRVCAITGGTAGIGRATALALAKLGATVVILGRSRERGEQARAEIAKESGKPDAVGGARLFGTSHVLPQLRLFALDDAEWLKALKLEGYASRRPSGPMPLQEVLFTYLEAT
jgi:NAD(P)-dependent dehydrogenase (short-subunit alcohol dehydrogenase family)